MTLTDLFDMYFQWWHSATSRYLELFQQQPFFFKGFGFSLEHYLLVRQLADRMIEETWRTMRLPTLEEVVRLHERFSLLESRLAQLQERDFAEEMAPVVENLKSLNKALTDIKKQIATVFKQAKR